VPSVEADPWIISAVRASNIESLTPHDCDLWYWSLREACISERARVMKERSRARG